MKIIIESQNQQLLSFVIEDKYEYFKAQFAKDLIDFLAKYKGNKKE